MFRRFFDYNVTSLSATVRVFVTGFIAGVMTWLLMSGLTTYVLDPILCRSAGSYCSSVPTIALVIALVIVHFVALIALIRLGILRPLLIILAVVASLWGFHVWTGGKDWWIAALESGLIFGLAYLAYTWMNRLLSFPVALVFTVLGVIATRLIVISW